MSVEINMNKHRVKKKFKRYLSHNAGTGKDTGHRDMTVSEDDLRLNWCRTFHTPEDWSFELSRCTKCGSTQQEFRFQQMGAL